MNHSLARRILYFGHGPFVSGFGVILLADLHVLVDIDFDNVLRSDFTERRQNGLDKKLLRAWNTRAHMAVIIGEPLVKHNAVAERNLLLQFVEIFFAAFHRNPLSSLSL